MYDLFIKLLALLGTWVWGRGTCDDKSDLTSLLLVFISLFRVHEFMPFYSTTVETLLKEGFTPERTIILSFGIDEESAGTQVSSILLASGLIAHMVLGGWSSGEVLGENIRKAQCRGHTG